MDKSKILVASSPVKRLVKFTDGTEETLHFLQVNGGEWRRWTENERSTDPDVRLYAMQRLIAASLCDDKGKQVISEKEAVNLTVTGINDLFPHVVEVSKGNAETKKG